VRASFAAIVVAQQAREARGGAQFPGFRAHLLGKGGRFAEVGFGRSAISLCVANYWIFDTNQQFATHRSSSRNIRTTCSKSHRPVSRA
jgi:hypothetical protein